MHNSVAPSFTAGIRSAQQTRHAVYGWWKSSIPNPKGQG